MKTKQLLIALAAPLLLGAFAACGSNDGPLNVKAPEWQEFVHPKTAQKLYKEANENSPFLQRIMEDNDGYGASMWQWSDEPISPLWALGDTEAVSDYGVFPLMGTEGDFYKIYVSDEQMGCYVGYIKKADCDIVKPAKLTQEVLQEVFKQTGRYDYIVADGAQKGLCLTTGLGEFEEPFFMIGQLCDNCIVYPEQNAFLEDTNETKGVSLTINEKENNYTLYYGEDAMTDNGSGVRAFDGSKMSEEQRDSVLNMLKTGNTEIREVAYYFPDVDKDFLKSVYFFDGEYYGAYTEEEPKPNGPVEKVGKGDLPKCDLRGPVRKAVMTTHFLDSESVYRFDREGKLISIDGDPGEAEFRLKTWIFESNSIGQITKVDYTLLIVGTHPEWHYTYNEDGDVIRIDDATSSAVSDNEPRPYAVEINERDAYGNWTKRTLKGEGEEPQTETRTIRYYKD